MRGRRRFLVAMCALAFEPASAGAQTSPSDTSPAPAPSASSTDSAHTSKLRDPEDGALDVSGFLDTAYGFIPIAAPITEPAVGYGAFGGLVFIKPKSPTKEGRPQRPDLAMIGGLGTANGTWGGFSGWSASWDDGRWHTLFGAGYASVNLDFYGVGDETLQESPAGYNVEFGGGLAEARYRIGHRPIYTGLRLAYARSDVTFDDGVLPPAIDPGELDADIAGVTPILLYDRRNNLFTPTKGIYLEADAGLYSKAFGGDFDFQNPVATALFFRPIAKRWFLGVEATGSFSFGDMPFFMRPGISLRGIEARRYIGEHAAGAEVELRWQFSRRFSAVGFGGAGTAWTNLDEFNTQQTVGAGGTGVRYLIARKYGIHLGLDVGFGPDDPIVYVVFGNAWFRP